MARRLVVVAVLVSSVSAVHLARPSAALAASCSSTQGYAFEGNFKQTTGIDGSSAKIEYVNEALCTGFNPNLHGSFSSSWVAIEGPVNDPNAIFQLGYDKCQGPGCPQQNLSYFFWARGWSQSLNCGPTVPATPHKADKGNATSGLHLFSVIRIGADIQARIDGVNETGATITWNFLVGTCWGSVVDAAWLNEVYNFGDQSGGPDSNRQNWENVLYHKGAWTSHTATTCNAIGPWAHQRCLWSTNPTDKFWTWDTRY